MDKGWVCLHRSLSAHWLWSGEPFSKGQAWVDLILHANHKPKKVRIKNQVIEVERGQQARSELTLSDAWKWSRGKVRRFLKQLEKEEMIVQQASKLTSIITICNYTEFQGDSTTDGTTSDTTDGTLVGHHTVHKQQCNNVNNEKNTLITDVTDQCPHDQIIELYHSNCPTLPRVKSWTDARKKLLRTRWRESKKHQSLEFWDGFFNYVNQSQFLTGGVQGNTFQANLEWLVRPSNFVKVIEENYHREQS